jgi:hypothetical protein
MLQVARIANWQIWKNRVRGLDLLAKGNPLWPKFVRQRHSLEMAFHEARRHIKSTGRCEYRLYCFVANITRVHDKLSKCGQSRLSGAIRRGLEKEFGLGSLDFEMKVATHLMSRGFDVEFHDFESGGGFDFLAMSGASKLEVECKHISADIGRKIHRRKLFDLGGLLYPAMSRAVQDKHDGIQLGVELPDRRAAEKSPSPNNRRPRQK